MVQERTGRENTLDGLVMEGNCRGKKLGAKSVVRKPDAPGGVKDEHRLLKTAEGGFELGVLMRAVLVQTVIFALEGIILAAKGSRDPAVALVLEDEACEKNQSKGAREHVRHGKAEV
jgi:hypothetical protein